MPTVAKKVVSRKTRLKFYVRFARNRAQLKQETATCAHQTRRAVTFSTITLDLWGIFAIDFHRNKPKTIENNNLLKKNRFFENSSHM